MLHTSIAESFRHNLRQVSPAIIALARTAKNCQEDIKSFLDLLDKENVDEEALASLGKYSAQTSHHEFGSHVPLE